MLPRSTRPLLSTLIRSTLAPRTSSSSSRDFSMTSPTCAGPLESSILQKLTASLSPTHLNITNDSSLHSHHSAMRAIGGGSGETHFTVEVVSDQFEGLRAIQRHRLVNGLLKEEFEEKGLHALVIKAKSPSEVAAK